MKNIALFLYLTYCLIACGQISSPRQSNHVSIENLRDTCDSPDAPINCSFVNMPLALSNTLTIAQNNEPGENLVITGTLYKEDGKTLNPNVILYAYQTDSNGYYSKKGTESGAQKWHGYLHGWCKTDSNGHYKIQTIRPARYPDNSMPAHIHAAVKIEDGQMYWISDFVFRDDDLVNKKYLFAIKNMVGGTGIIDVHINAENKWIGKRDIVLTK